VSPQSLGSTSATSIRFARVLSEKFVSNVEQSPPRKTGTSLSQFRAFVIRQLSNRHPIKTSCPIVSTETIIVAMETELRSRTSPLESHLGYLLRRVSNAVSGSFAQSLQARQTSVAEWVLLRHLHERSQATPGELAETLTMTRGAISKIMDKLQAKGWIKSRIKPEDNRAQLLSLTAAGRRVVPKLAGIADRNDDKFFAFLDSGERQLLRALLIKLADHHQIRNVPLE
jgi:DNA-binding MarR family transcriptional regulator